MAPQNGGEATERTDGVAGRPGRPAMSRAGLSVTVLLVVAGVVALVGSSQLPRERARLVGGNLPVDRGALDPLDLSARNSPAMVANPVDRANLAIAHRVDLPRFGCGLQVTLDGGVNWAAAQVPQPEGKIVACFAPDATFGPEGTLYMSFISFAAVENLGVVPDAIWVTRSSDGGQTWAPVVRAAGPSAFQARLSADPVTPGRLYLVWLRAAETLPYGLATTANPIVFSRSDDGGATWSEPTTVSAAGRQRVVAPSVAVDGRARVYVSYLDVGGDSLDYAGAHEDRGGEPFAGKWSLVVARSDSGGDEWTESVVDAAVVPTQRFRMLFPPAPSLAVDRSNGRLYVAFHDGRGGDADVWLWTSDDGRRWRPPHRVDGGQPRDSRSQYLPAVAVSPEGRVDVVYYDRRRDPQDLRNDVSVQSSFDGGRAFTPPLRLNDRSFDSTIGFGKDRGLVEMGNRLGLVSTEAGLMAAWADTRAGDHVSGKQSITRALAAVTPASQARQTLRTGGALVLGGAAAILIAVAVSAWWRRRAQGALQGGILAGEAGPTPDSASGPLHRSRNDEQRLGT